jgi:hypothetical protein
MAGCDGEPSRLEVTFDELEVGPAHAAGADVDDDLPRSGVWRRSFGPAQRPLLDRCGLFEDLALHGCRRSWFPLVQPSLISIVSIVTGSSG